MCPYWLLLGRIVTSKIGNQRPIITIKGEVPSSESQTFLNQLGRWIQYLGAVCLLAGAACITCRLAHVATKQYLPIGFVLGACGGVFIGIGKWAKSRKEEEAVYLPSQPKRKAQLPATPPQPKSARHSKEKASKVKPPPKSRGFARPQDKPQSSWKPRSQGPDKPRYSFGWSQDKASDIPNWVKSDLKSKGGSGIPGPIENRSYPTRFCESRTHKDKSRRSARKETMNLAIVCFSESKWALYSRPPAASHIGDGVSSLAANDGSKKGLRQAILQNPDSREEVVGPPGTYGMIKKEFDSEKACRASALELSKQTHCKCPVIWCLDSEIIKREECGWRLIDKGSRHDQMYQRAFECTKAAFLIVQPELETVKSFDRRILYCKPHASGGRVYKKEFINSKTGLIVPDQFIPEGRSKQTGQLPYNSDHWVDSLKWGGYQELVWGREVLPPQISWEVTSHLHTTEEILEEDENAWRLTTLAATINRKEAWSSMKNTWIYKTTAKQHFTTHKETIDMMAVRFPGGKWVLYCRPPGTYSMVQKTFTSRWACRRLAIELSRRTRRECAVVGDAAHA